MYVVLLTFALLAPDPLAWIRTRPKGPPKPLPPYLAWILNDKTQHFTAYAILTALLLGGTRWRPAAAFTAAAAHGGAIEILQQWFPPREMEFMDWVADLTGATAALVVYFFLSRRRPD